MDRSLGFGSTADYSVALFRLAFATAPPVNGINLATYSNSPVHYTKGTPLDYSGIPKGPFHPPTACRHTVSGSISLPSPGFFSPFPHGTSSLSVTREYLALGGGPPRFPQDSSCPVVLGKETQEVRYPFVYRAITVFGLPFQRSLTRARIFNFPTLPHLCRVSSHYPSCTTHAGFNVQTGLGSSPFARRYLGNRGCFLFLGVLRWFSSPRSPSPPILFNRELPDITRTGFPHSEIPGSKVVCTSPGLIAAYYVLHRLLVPRHPPYALTNLTNKDAHPLPVQLSKSNLIGGDNRIRTGDLRLARAALSQLSYIPFWWA